jgi:hypothetical protein
MRSNWLDLPARMPGFCRNPLGIDAIERPSAGHPSLWGPGLSVLFFAFMTQIREAIGAASYPVPMSTRRFGLLILVLSLAAAAGADTVSLSQERTAAGTLYHVEGAFEVTAPLAQVWDVLTDYGALKGVVSSLQASEVLSREGNSVLVQQVVLGHFLFFSKSLELLLKVEESPRSSLSFAQACAKPFRVYDGSWTLTDQGASVAVAYRLNVSSGDLAPAFIERRLFRDNARSLLQELKAEISRRAALPLAAPKKIATLIPVIKAPRASSVD